jgi:ribonuclease D
VNVPKLLAPVLITEDAQLRTLADELKLEQLVAVDTESNSLYAYQERVCLIQFSTPHTDYLVDPLSLDDLSPLGQVFASEQPEIIFHAAEYDVICLKRDFGFEFANIFDTMIAARILGRRAIGLGSMLKAEFSVRLNKRYQRANWGRRPLPEHMLKYAQLDTHYLIPLRHRLKAKVEERGLWPLAEEDFVRVCNVEGRAAKESADDVWRIHGSHDLSPQQAAVLQELCRYRDRVAKSMDRPVFKVIDDQTLMAIALESPTAREVLRRIPGMTPRRLRAHEGALMRTVKHGLQAAPAYPPRGTRPDGAYVSRLEALRVWRKLTAEGLGVNSDVVLPRELMLEIARKAPCKMGELVEIMQDVPWRLSEYGKEIIRLMSQFKKQGKEYL